MIKTILPKDIALVESNRGFIRKERKRIKRDKKLYKKIMKKIAKEIKNATKRGEYAARIIVNEDIRESLIIEIDSFLRFLEYRKVKFINIETSCHIVIEWD